MLLISRQFRIWTPKIEFPFAVGIARRVLVRNSSELSALRMSVDKYYIGAVFERTASAAMSIANRITCSNGCLQVCVSISSLSGIVVHDQ